MEGFDQSINVSLCLDASSWLAEREVGDSIVQEPPNAQVSGLVTDGDMTGPACATRDIDEKAPTHRTHSAKSNTLLVRAKLR